MANNKETLQRYAKSHKDMIRESGRKYRDSHKEAMKEYRKKYQELHREETNAKAREAYKRDIVKKKEYQKKYIKETKLKFLDMYGNACVCCGETIPDLLTIEHKLGQIRKTKETGTVAYRKAIQKYSPDLYEILCWNCNCARGQLGYCPHNPTIVENYKIHNSDVPYIYTKEVDTLGRRYIHE